MNPQCLEESLCASDSFVNSDYLAGPLDWHVRFEPNGELLVVKVDADATLANSNPIHLVGSPPVFSRPRTRRAGMEELPQQVLANPLQDILGQISESVVKRPMDA